MMPIRNLAAAIVLAIIGVPVAASSQGATRDTAVDILKGAYLACERAAVTGRLGSGDIMRCSVIYEELKQRSFGGDFERLKAWADEYLRPPSARERGTGFIAEQ